MTAVLSDPAATLPCMHFHPWRALRSRPDITVRWEYEPGRRGSWCQRTKTIRLDPQQLQRERRVTVLHEQIHAARGHEGCQDVATELSVRKGVARRLITIYGLVDAVLFYGQHDLAALAAFGRTRLDEIGPTSVRQLVSSLLATRAPKTVRNVHAVLFNIMALAVEEGLLEANPCAGTRLPKNQRKKARAYLTEQQVEQIIATVPAEQRPLVVLLATTGLRWGEAAGLKAKHVDLLGRRLRVEETLNETGGVLSWGTPKSEASVRTVTLPARAVDVLLPLLAGKGGDDLVFTAAQGGPVRHRNFYTRAWVPSMRALELTDPQPSVHDLRHAHASVLVSRGVPMMAVKERLGHESIATTDKLYAFLAPSVDDVVLAALDEAFGDPLAIPAVPLPSPDAAAESENSL